MAFLRPAATGRGGPSTVRVDSPVGAGPGGMRWNTKACAVATVVSNCTERWPTARFAVGTKSYPPRRQTNRLLAPASQNGLRHQTDGRRLPDRQHLGSRRSSRNHQRRRRARPGRTCLRRPGRLWPDLKQRCPPSPPGGHARKRRSLSRRERAGPCTGSRRAPRTADPQTASGPALAPF